MTARMMTEGRRWRSSNGWGNGVECWGRRWRNEDRGPEMEGYQMLLQVTGYILGQGMAMSMSTRSWNTEQVGGRIWKW